MKLCKVVIHPSSDGTLTSLGFPAWRAILLSQSSNCRFFSFLIAIVQNGICCESSLTALRIFPRFTPPGYPLTLSNSVSKNSTTSAYVSIVLGFPWRESETIQNCLRQRCKIFFTRCFQGDLNLNLNFTKVLFSKVTDEFESFFLNRYTKELFIIIII